MRANKAIAAKEAATKDQSVANALDKAWKIHAVQVDWTGKVDGKAVFAFGIQSAALGLAVTLGGTGRLFSQLHTPIGFAVYYLGIASLLLGAGFALFVVRPRLRSRAAEQEHEMHTSASVTCGTGRQRISPHAFGTRTICWAGWPRNA